MVILIRAISVECSYYTIYILGISLFIAIYIFHLNLMWIYQRPHGFKIFISSWSMDIQKATVLSRIRWSISSEKREVTQFGHFFILNWNHIPKIYQFWEFVFVCILWWFFLHGALIIEQGQNQRPLPLNCFATEKQSSVFSKCCWRYFKWNKDTL